jgi:hypothetical protein
MPLAHPRLRRDSHHHNYSSRNGIIFRNDMLLNTHQWSDNVIGKISEYLQFDGTNVSNETRLSSELSLIEEFSYACHLGLQAIILPR